MTRSKFFTVVGAALFGLVFRNAKPQRYIIACSIRADGKIRVHSGGST